MIQVILDTNFLVYCAENKIDYKTEIDNLLKEGYELVVPSQVIEELNVLFKTAKKLTDRSASWLALKLLEHNQVKVIAVSATYADEAIIRLLRIGSVVATLDLELRKKLRGARVIVVTGVRKLAFA